VLRFTSSSTLDSKDLRQFIARLFFSGCCRKSLRWFI